MRAYLEADLVDHLHVAIAPIILGSGVRLWDNQRGLESRLPSVKSETAESGTIHLTFAR
nr:dihydrofolate reductase family protein [Devosia submarina]